ncbi:MAG: tail fiber domain-containing protein, partial [Chitinophagia bacterium]|nr:tail fiber domain-containing protein [Chitinophagia bacterium]
ETTSFVDGEPYAREVRVYTRGTGLVHIEVDTEPDAGGFVEPREARAIAERRRGLDPVVVWSESASGPWLVASETTTTTVPLVSSVFLALADAATGSKLVLAPRSSPALRVVGTALLVEDEGTFVVSVDATKNVEVDGLSVRADVRATTLTVRVVRAAPTVTGPSVVACAPGLTAIRFTVTSARAGTLAVVVDDEPELRFPIVASASATTVDALVRTENHTVVRATIKGTQATCVVRLAAPAVAARLVSAWVLSSASARLAVTPAGISTRVRRVAVELLGADGTRAEVESADAVWLDERGEPVSPAARAQTEDGLLVLARDQATAIGMVVVREGARTSGGGVTYAPLRAVNGTSMAATAVCEPWHVGRDALVGLVAMSPVACELRFRHRYCAAVRSVGAVLVGGVGSTFGVAEGKVVLDVDPGQMSVELVLVVCARLAAASIVVVEPGARAFLCADAAWRAGRSYELTPVDSHGQACLVPTAATFPSLEASVDGSVWVPVAAAFTVEERRVVVVPETWGAFTERRVVLAPGRVVRVITIGATTTTTTTDASHADFTFGTGSLVSSSPTISHGANNVSTTGSITAARCSAGAFFATSDARLKTNVATIDGALEKCARMRGVTFEYAADRGTVHVGLIAQEVAAVFPSLVTEIDGFQRVDYSKLVGVLIEAVKELKERPCLPATI